jgi:hypothetical protein
MHLQREQFELAKKMDERLARLESDHRLQDRQLEDLRRGREPS